MARPKTIEELLRILRDDRSVPELRTYFNIDTPDAAPRYTGARFDTLGCGGGRDEVRDVITPYDLLAVACLDVTVPTPVALELVEGPLGREIGACLRGIPTGVALGEAGARECVEPGSFAVEAWELLKASDNVGWVIAGKVLARKRPRLIPVWTPSSSAPLAARKVPGSGLMDASGTADLEQNSIDCTKLPTFLSWCSLSAFWTWCSGCVIVTNIIVPAAQA